MPTVGDEGGDAFDCDIALWEEEDEVPLEGGVKKGCGKEGRLGQLDSFHIWREGQSREGE